MSTHARIAVRSTHTETVGWAWAASVEHADAVLDCEAGYAPTRDAAQAAAYAALGGMQQRLMDEVHASRASRREKKPADVHTMEPTA